MSGRIVAEYEDYSIYETKMSKPVAVAASDFVRIGVDGRCENLPLRTSYYHVAQSYQIRVKTYAQALLEPEHEVFI